MRMSSESRLCKILISTCQLPQLIIRIGIRAHVVLLPVIHWKSRAALVLSAAVLSDWGMRAEHSSTTVAAARSRASRTVHSSRSEPNTLNRFFTWKYVCGRVDACLEIGQALNWPPSGSWEQFSSWSACNDTAWRAQTPQPCAEWSPSQAAGAPATKLDPRSSNCSLSPLCRKQISGRFILLEKFKISFWFRTIIKRNDGIVFKC